MRKTKVELLGISYLVGNKTARCMPCHWCQCTNVCVCVCVCVHAYIRICMHIHLDASGIHNLDCEHTDSEVCVYQIRHLCECLACEIRRKLVCRWVCGCVGRCVSAYTYTCVCVLPHSFVYSLYAYQTKAPHICS
jgi:hypothetical protein